MNWHQRMLGHLIVPIGLLLATAVAPSQCWATDDSKSARAPEVDAVIGEAVTGNVAAAVATLRGMATAGLSDRDSKWRQCMLGRFGEATAAAVEDPPMPDRSRRILEAYRRYWRDVLVGRLSRDQGEANLRRDLGAVLPEQPGVTTDMDERTEQARLAIEKDGLHALTGQTMPFWELMIWTKQDDRSDVQHLPGGDVEVQVHLLDKFASLGWLAYATCDRAFTGGWAKDKGLFAVVPAYESLDSEEFKVSFLGHESQHFSDYKHFPKLQEPDLEYRAKLVEIIMSQKSTRNLLDFFKTSAQRSRALPHPFANYWVTQRLDGLSDEQARQKARELLAESTRELTDEGAESVSTSLPE